MIATLIFIRLRINWKTLKQRHFTFSCTYDSNVYLYKINVHSQKNACLNLCKTSLVAKLTYFMSFLFDFQISQLDAMETLQDLRLYPQETLILEEKWTTGCVNDFSPCLLLWYHLYVFTACYHTKQCLPCDLWHVTWFYFKRMIKM